MEPMAHSQDEILASQEPSVPGGAQLVLEARGEKAADETEQAWEQ